MRDRFDIQGLIFIACQQMVIVADPSLLVHGFQARNTLPKLHPTLLGPEIDVSHGSRRDQKAVQPSGIGLSRRADDRMILAGSGCD
jgi:hypothetical protein